MAGEFGRLLRADPQSWRGWDGKSFSVRFVRDDQAKDAPEAHLCAPVAPDALQGTVRSIVRHRASGLFIATLAMTRDGRTGIWTTTSPDLVSWSKPELLWAVPLLFRYGCGDMAAFDYPALLDPGSQGRNFDDVGKTAYVYMTRLNLDKCKITWNRDLVRMRVEIDGG